MSFKRKRDVIRDLQGNNLAMKREIDYLQNNILELKQKSEYLKEEIQDLLRVNIELRQKIKVFKEKKEQKNAFKMEI